MGFYCRQNEHYFSRKRFPGTEVVNNVTCMRQNIIKRVVIDMTNLFVSSVKMVGNHGVHPYTLTLKFQKADDKIFVCKFSRNVKPKLYHM